MPSLFATLLTATLASAATVVVKVGENGLSFEPQNVTAAVGDVVEFHFWPANHSVVAGDLEDACTPLSDDGTEGFYSGFMPVASGMGENVFQVEIPNTDPWAFYCSQGQHCQGGMWGMINGDDETFSTYRASLADADANVSPAVAGPFGGEVVAMDAAANGTTDADADADDSAAGVVAASLGTAAAAFFAAVMLV